MISIIFTYFIISAMFSFVVIRTIKSYLLQGCVVISENGCFASQGIWTPTEPNGITTDVSGTTDNSGTSVLTDPTSTNVDLTTENGSTTDSQVTTTETASIETTTPNICPPNFSGMIPHPVHCERFYHCVNGIQIPLFCSDGEEFDPDLLVSL